MYNHNRCAIYGRYSPVHAHLLCEGAHKCAQQNKSTTNFNKNFQIWLPRFSLRYAKVLTTSPRATCHGRLVKTSAPQVNARNQISFLAIVVEGKVWSYAAGLYKASLHSEFTIRTHLRLFCLRRTVFCRHVAEWYTWVFIRGIRIW